MIYISCGLKQPVETGGPQTGSLSVTTDIPGAAIYINYSDIGEVSPFLIENLPVGTYIIHALLDSFKTVPDSMMVQVMPDATRPLNFNLTKIDSPGFVFVDSEPKDALIRVNKKFSGKKTPAYLVLEPGLHNISLIKSSRNNFTFNQVSITTGDTLDLSVSLEFRSPVLIESFANSSCLPCTLTSRYLEDFEHLNNEYDYAIIEYFSNFPNPNDPMYKHDPAGNFARMAAYQITGVPSLFIAGKAVDPQNFNEINNTFQSSLGLQTDQYNLSVSKQITDSVYASIDFAASAGLPAGDWRLFAAVIEKEVNFDSPPGSNGLSTFYHVFRRFFTANQGDNITLTDGQFSKNYTLPVSAEWDINKLTVIAFIQDISNHEILITSKN